MKLKDFIVDKLSSFGAELSANELSALMIDNDFSDSTDYSTIKAKSVLVSIIPSIIAGQESISEGGYSVKYNREGLASYYSILCNDLDVPNALKAISQVRDASNYW